ncbi:MAG: type IV secretory system conjugative DNA transfer family protein [Candidatus Dormibacteraceae bacterium]
MNHRLLILIALIQLTVLVSAIGLALLREREHRRPGVLLDILPPEGASADLRSWTLFYQSLYAISHPWWKRLLFGQPWIVLELWSKDGDLGARCWAPARLERMVTILLRGAMPGAQLQPSTAPIDMPGCAARARLRLDIDPLHALSDPRPEALRSVTQALVEAPSGLVQFALSPDESWQKRARRQLDALAGVPPERGLLVSVLGWLLDGLFHLVLPEQPMPPAPPPRSSRPLPSAGKASIPGYRAEIRLRASAGSDEEASAHMHGLVAAVRGFDGANGLRPARVWFGRSFDRRLASRSAPAGNMILVADELAGLFHLPVDIAGFGAAPTRLSPARRPSGDGKVICLLEDGRQTPVRISSADARHHIHVLGPTGVGKSTLLLNLALDDIEAGRGVAVVDPKGDLVSALLERIPRPHWDRVLLVDPSLRDQPVGLNVLECDDPELHEVACDQLVTIFRKAYERFWGPRTDDILRAAVLTLLLRPGSSLCEVPLLLLQPEARRVFTSDLRDPVGLGPFWDEYEQMADGQRLQMVGPVLNKLRSVLLRRTVRNIMGQPRSTIDLAACMDQGGILLVSLAKGLLGEETSRLLGAFLVARLWQAAMARAARPQSTRSDFSLYLDEFQNYLHLPQSLEDVLVEARGYHLGLVLANQHLGQLASATREALAANARTRVVFQCGQDDARYLAREFSPWLGDLQLRNLQPHQVAVRQFRDGRTERPFTGVTRPEPPSFGADHAAALTAAALARCGRPRADVENEIEERLRAYDSEAADRDKVATADDGFRNRVRNRVRRRR